MSICAFPAHDLHVTVSRTRVTLALAPGRALEGNNTVGNWKTVTVPPLLIRAPERRLIIFLWTRNHSCLDRWPLESRQVRRWHWLFSPGLTGRSYLQL